MAHCVYILRDPASLRVRYVGVTNNFAQRFANHLAGPRGEQRKTWGVYPVSRWLQELAQDGLLPISAIVERLENDDDWRAAEKRWIYHYKDMGEPLLNLNYPLRSKYKKHKVLTNHVRQKAYWAQFTPAERKQLMRPVIDAMNAARAERKLNAANQI